VLLNVSGDKLLTGGRPEVAFGQLLRKFKFRGDINYEQVLQMAKTSKGKDDEGYRAEFIRIVEMASLIR